MMNNFLLKRKIKKLIKNSERERAYLSLREIKSVMVLFDTEDFEDANFFIKHLKKLGKRIKVFAYKNSNDVNNYSRISYTPVVKKNMKYLRSESLNQINSLLSEKFDLVVDLTLKENLLLLYVLVAANSPLKIGIYKHTPQVHDIVISSFSHGPEQNIKELGEQLIYYLTTISSNT